MVPLDDGANQKRVMIVQRKLAFNWKAGIFTIFTGIWYTKIVLQ
jgi:hypothetical protein